MAQPTAARLFAALTDAEESLTTAEAAEMAGVHPNSARFHLGELAEAGLIKPGTAHGSRGRPRKTWSVTASGRAAGSPPEAYRELAGWLGRSVAVMAADSSEIRGQGRRIGREIAAETAGQDGASVLEDSLRAMGFWPQRETAGRTTRFTLCNCPYREVAESNVPVICTLHLGIAEGIAHASCPRSRVTSFEPRDPQTAGCTIEIEAIEPTSEESR